MQLQLELSTPIDNRKLGQGRLPCKMPIRICPYIITKPKNGEQ